MPFEGNKSSASYFFTALNDSVFEIQLKEPFPAFLGLLSMIYCSVVPKEVVEHYGKEFRKNPIGTGAFKFKMWKEGVKLVFIKNENYFERVKTKSLQTNAIRLPYLDAIDITFIIDKQTAFLEFVKGNLDFISGIDQSYKDELLTRTGELNPKYRNIFNLLRLPYLNTEYLGFLMEENKFKSNDCYKVILNKNIRQAFKFKSNASRCSHHEHSGRPRCSRLHAWRTCPHRRHH